MSPEGSLQGYRRGPRQPPTSCCPLTGPSARALLLVRQVPASPISHTCPPQGEPQGAPSRDHICLEGTLVGVLGVCSGALKMSLGPLRVTWWHNRGPIELAPWSWGTPSWVSLH